MIGPLRSPFDPSVLFPSVPYSASDPVAAERHSTGGDSALPPLQAVEASRSWHDDTAAADDVRPFETSLHAPQHEGAVSSLTLGESADESPSFRISEGALARLEAGLRAQERMQVPRAGQLPPGFGLGPVAREGSSGSSQRTFNPLSFQPSPPLAPERLRSQALKQRRANLDVSLFVLLAGAITVAVAFHFSTAGVTPEVASIKVEPFELSPKPIAQPIETEVKNKTGSEETNKGDSQSVSQAQAPSKISAVSTTSIESTTPSLSTTASPRSHGRKTRHSGSGARPKSQ